MIYVDAHCDTITKIMEFRQDLNRNSCHIDIERMNRVGSCIQFFAAFIDPSFGQAYAMKRAVQIIDKYYLETEKYSDSIMSCCNYSDIERALSEKKAAALLSIEGGDALQGDMSALRMFYRLGVRSVCLTWNHRNEIADGVGDSSTGGGLTSFGREAVREMNRLGMLVDLSHIAEKGFWDVMDITKAPVIVSHSNAKKICSHRRNLTDEQLLAVKNNGGVVGINLYPHFLNDSGKASMKDIIAHIEYIAGLIGTEHMGIGADFDGIESTPEGINGIEDIASIIKELEKLNYKSKDIEDFAGMNFLRVIKEVL
ncbi:MAG: dipeptidase [Clostridia bacterium]|nr:dipeptidase [Clostridia bacterium]